MKTYYYETETSVHGGWRKFPNDAIARRELWNEYPDLLVIYYEHDNGKDFVIIWNKSDGDCNKVQDVVETA